MINLEKATDNEIYEFIQKKGWYKKKGTEFHDIDMSDSSGFYVTIETIDELKKMGQIKECEVWVNPQYNDIVDDDMDAIITHIIENYYEIEIDDFDDSFPISDKDLYGEVGVRHK